MRKLLHVATAGWTPLWLGSALVEWWDPEARITKDGGTDRVSSWIGKISSTDATNPTGGNQPLWVAASSDMNGRPSLYFDGSRVLFANGTVPAAVRVWQQAHTIVGVSRGYNDVMGNGQDAAGTFLLMRYNTKVRAHVWGTSGSRTIDGATTLSNTTRALVGQRASGPPAAGNLEPTLNGASDATPASIGGSAATPLNWITLGGRNSVPAGAGFIGHLGDQFIFNRALTDMELRQLAHWAKQRWNIA